MASPRSYFGCLAVLVGDMDRSTRFYTEALGFRQLSTTRPNGGAAGVTARFIEKDGAVFELVQLDTPPPADQSTRPMERTGMMSHLAINVVDLAEVEAAVIAAGGNVVEGSRMALELDGIGPAEIVYARDPDGIWIELTRIDESARRRYAGLDR